MRESSARSQTAESVAACRASHFLHAERPLVFEDPYAIELLGQEWRERSLADVGEIWQHPTTCVILGRSRYTEDQLEAAVRLGVDQYVILGAGLDTFALRRPDLMETISVYEVDTPATQEWKRDSLAKLVDELPAALEFIPTDLEHETIAESLARSSFRSDRLSFFSWLGSTVYLSREGVFRTLKSIAAASAPGSEIFFDYCVSDEFITEQEDVAVAHVVYEYTSQVGEPHTAFLNPHTLPNEVGAVGFEVIENISPKQMDERYFIGRSDGLRVATYCYYIHLRNSGKVGHQQS